MAFKNLYPIRYLDSHTLQLEFLHEIIHTPMAGEQYLKVHGDGFHEPHAQEYCELIFFQSGSRDIRVGQTEYTFCAGDLLVVTPEETHVGRSHDCILDRYYLHVYPQAFAHLKDGGKAVMGIFYNRKPYTNNKITLPHEARMRLQKLLSLLDNTLRFGSPDTREVEAYALVIEVLGVLAPFADAQHPQKTVKDALFLNILSYIENSYPEPDVIKQVQVSFGISRSTLWRMFKLQMQMTPGEYLLQVRLQNAKRCLDDGYDVTQTAVACGFSDSSHFIKRFKERYGVTPRVYRETIKNGKEI